MKASIRRPKNLGAPSQPHEQLVRERPFSSFPRDARRDIFASLLFHAPALRAVTQKNAHQRSHGRSEPPPARATALLLRFGNGSAPTCAFLGSITLSVSPCQN